jgi:mRNA interferase RelE/StbE
VNGGVRWTHRASKDLARLDRQTQRRIVAAVERFAQTGHGDVKRLSGLEEEIFRLRVGDWRILFSRSEVLGIRVLRVSPRSGAYQP